MAMGNGMLGMMGIAERGGLGRAMKGRVVRARRPLLDMVRSVLHRSGGLKLAQLRRTNVILMFHEIAPEEAEALQKLLRYLARHFVIISLDEMLQRVAGKQPFENAALALTFDDGLRNHRRIVYPILRELGLPATFYVCPGLIGTGTIWTWELACRIPWLEASARRELYETAGLGPEADPATFVQHLKGLPVAGREAVETEIRVRTPDFSLSAKERDLYELMDWDDIRELDPALITIGSHSMTHPDLPQVDDNRLAREITESRAELERRLGRPVVDFCYPNGHHDGRVLAQAAKVYRSAVTTAVGCVRRGDSPWALKRIEVGTDPVWATWALALRAG